MLFSSLYTTGPQTHLKSRLEILYIVVVWIDGTSWYKYVVLGRKYPYHVKHESTHLPNISVIVKLLEILIDNIFSRVVNVFSQETLGIPIRSNRALPSTISDFLDDLIQKKEHRLSRYIYIPEHKRKQVYGQKHPSNLLENLKIWKKNVELYNSLDYPIVRWLLRVLVIALERRKWHFSCI